MRAGGHSWGGVLVQLLAFRRPDLAAGLVLVDPGHEEMESELPLPLQWGWRIMQPLRDDASHRQARCIRCNGRLPDSAQEGCSQPASSRLSCDITRCSYP